MTPEQLAAQGFTRVERDDRLLDVFPNETPEKGVELWEKWAADSVELIRMHDGRSTDHTFPLGKIEQALASNRKLALS